MSLITTNFSFFLRHFSIVLIASASAAAAAGVSNTYTVSQCVTDRNVVQRINLSCPPHHMIHVRRAFHGVRSSSSQCASTTTPSTTTTSTSGGGGARGLAGISPGYSTQLKALNSSHCSYCETDCTDDAASHVYDWSSCTGRESCSRNVVQSRMPSRCAAVTSDVETQGHATTMKSTRGRQQQNSVSHHLTAAADRDNSVVFSDYIQVDYDCVNRSEVFDVCETGHHEVRAGFLATPGYPAVYPANTDCLCRLETPGKKTLLQLTFYDLVLETRNGRCQADWIMIRQNDERHRHCGAILKGTKSVTSSDDVVDVQFHSDEHDNMTQNFQLFTRLLKGVWLHFTPVPTDAIVSVTCRRLNIRDPEVREIHGDDVPDIDDVTSFPASTNGTDSLAGDGVTQRMTSRDVTSLSCSVLSQCGLHAVSLVVLLATFSLYTQMSFNAN